MDEMNSQMTSLLEEDELFDPTSHPSVQEFSQILARDRTHEGDDNGVDEDVQVGQVKWQY